MLSNFPSRISDTIRPWAERIPEHPALVEASGTWTYGQLAGVVEEAKTWLLNAGVRSGDRLMIVLENCRAFAAVVLAAAAIDAWPVLVNAKLSPSELDAIRDHCGARRVIYLTAVSHHAREHAKRHGAAIESIGNLGSLGISPINDAVLPEACEANPAENVAALIYTSGTTGLPKGVMLTHRNVLFIAEGAVKIRSLNADDRLYGVLPMSHAVGFSVVFLGSLLSGATLYLAPRFDPVATIKVLEKEGISVLLGAPAMFSLLVEYTKTKGMRSLYHPSLRIISSSGAPLHQGLKSEVEELFGLVLHNGYGVTECSPTIAQTRVESPRRDVSVGPVFPGSNIKLVGPTGTPVAEGEVGELHVSGPNVMKGYYHAPEETAAAIDTEGWFNTRDLARMEDSNLFIVGRTKELIVHFGLNVYPAEVEAVLNGHPKVVRSAVLGRTVDASAGGEEVIAFVQELPNSNLSDSELLHYAAQHLAPYKRPSQICVVSSLPLTPTGKVIKEGLTRLSSPNPQHKSELPSQ